MKRKIVAMSMVFLLLAGNVYGCGKKEVDYNVEGKGKTESSSSDIAQFKDEKKWKDEWKMKATGYTDMTGEKLDEVKISINAELILPDVKSMSVVEAEQTKIDEDFRKQFLKNYFEESEIYYHDVEHYTRSELENAISRLESRQKIYKDRLDGFKESLGEMDVQVMDMNRQYEESQELVQKMKECLLNASDNYMVTEELGTGTDYAGKRGDIVCKVEFKDTSVSAKPIDGQYYGPKTLRDYDTVNRVEQEKKDNDAANTKNECKFSLKEAKELAEEFMKKIGRSNQVCQKTENVKWHGENTQNASNGADESYAVYGYTFTYGTGVEGVAFSDFEVTPDVFLPDEITDFGEPIPTYLSTVYTAPYYHNGDRIKITVTDEGIIEVSLESPVDIQSVTKQVELLPLDTVKDIIKSEFEEHSEEYYFGAENTFNRMELVYLKRRDSSKDDSYSFVPAWCLSQYTTEGYLFQEPIYVNAIDGTIIYARKELVSGNDDSNN